MKKIVLTFSFFLLGICWPHSSGSRAYSDPSSALQAPIDFSLLEQALQEEMKAQSVPGAQIAAISGDRVVFQKSFGTANVETNEAVTTETLFRLGSTTKTFVAAAAVTPAEQGKLDLTKPVGNYAKGLHAQIARLTMPQLRSHTAGLKDEAPMTGPLQRAATPQYANFAYASMCSYKVSVHKSIHTPQHKGLLTLLRQRRSEAGLTQAHLAARIHKDQTFVGKYEPGERRLDVLEL